MAEIVYPSELVHDGWGFRFARAQAVGPETLDGGQQVLVKPGGRWLATISYKLAGSTQIRAFETLLARLDGMANYAAFPRLHPFSINYATAGVPLAAAAAGSSLLRVAATAFGSASWSQGMYLSVDGWMHMVAAVDTGTPGENRLTLYPELRADISVASVLATKATCRLRLTSPDQGLAFLNAGRAGTVSLSLREALDVLAS